MIYSLKGCVHCMIPLSMSEVLNLQFFLFYHIFFEVGQVTGLCQSHRLLVQVVFLYTYLILVYSSIQLSVTISLT